MTITMLSTDEILAALTAAGLPSVDAIPAWTEVRDPDRLSAVPLGGYMPSRGPSARVAILDRATDLVRDLKGDIDHDLCQTVERIIWAVAGPDRIREVAERSSRDDVLHLVDREVRSADQTVRDVLVAAVATR